ncbi:hypothetical protein GH733_011476 [Mirounga leonina]|nr:hypothetical protein GH733_011476 [Mirounga leonina]
MHKGVPTTGRPRQVQPGRAKGKRFSCLIPELTLQLVAAWSPTLTIREPALSVEAELVPSPSLTCAFIALSILDAHMVPFPEALVLIKNYFPLQKQLGYAKSILSVSSPFLNSDVSGTKNDRTEREFWEMQRMKTSLSSLQILTFPKCLKRKETNTLGGNFFLLTLLSKKILTFVCFPVPLRSIGIVKYVVHSQNQGKSCFTCCPFADLLVLSGGPLGPKVRPGCLPGS